MASNYVVLLLARGTWILGGQLPFQGIGHRLLGLICYRQGVRFMDRETWQTTVHGITKSRTQLSD